MLHSVMLKYPIFKQRRHSNLIVFRLGRIPQEEVYGQEAEDKKVNEEEEEEEGRKGKNGGKGEEEGGEEGEQTGERKPLESLSGERVHGVPNITSR